ncbi:Cof-type HAD-IIB family hydrolase [Mesomycoplasma ovipneumoniae]|uniref:Cof-type HAD-IIB family hydrolase n=1 Tax=Mesomycoplasma ovipneumoniae TaxID=29562 RepID=A0AAJ2UA60_9BACT|nr:Cof-type HAD-IIB family hydrolase [Mesomycoplasma ovipneumoniae]MDW2892791.1 Cof-type HAD-IIB family hydrolase [Mesomycoplasma ovipneumoniae]MDW2908676.1 Cof-type HAD-IIB family hydrolase [Mesomycoplasma ovipneumoniae]WNM13903.1 Cof-type HAD-IIB family hydrolase [Mesomycoplasma ovipneumoniae]
MKISKNRYLFVLDLDGTVLSDSANSEIHPDTESEIKRAVELGHVVCILTGRPWRSTKPIYEKLGLNTIVANFNGAYIHNPTDSEFIPTINYINLNDILYIMGDKRVKAETSNFAIEGPGWAKIKKRDKQLEQVFGFDHIKNLKPGLNFHKIPLKPTCLILDTKPTTNINDFKSYLERRYGDLGEFSAWSKGENHTYVFDMTAIGVNKSKAVSMLSRYYKIDLENIISIGDSYNDIGMFEIATISVAMANSPQQVKKNATVILKKTNKEGGVGDYIRRFLKDPIKEIEKSKKRKETRSAVTFEATEY